MADPLEGTAPDGTIVTGAARGRVPVRYEPVLADLIAGIADHDGAALYLFGSVANGTAQSPTSDVDVLAIGLDDDVASRLSAKLSTKHDALASGVDVGAVPRSMVAGTGDESYGFRVFIRHYCVHLAGPDQRPTQSYLADAAAARGFNGDIARHLAAWRSALTQGAPPAQLGRRIARKSLLAAAGLASIASGEWTTNREAGAAWLAIHHPLDANDAATLLAWATDELVAEQQQVSDILTGTVDRLAAAFAQTIGLWP